ncbi:MAG TPA: hypothetical protein VMU30_04425, partial [Bacteroidota bacterium]|nr:hypothetical protein [Bacteroidota bacterium]
MFEKCLMEAEAILNSQKEPFVPVSMVWEEMVKRAKTKGFEVVSLPDFTALLEGDQRFQILPAKKDDDDGLVDDENLDDPEMDQMGFFPEDRVRLRSSRVEEIEPSSEEDEEISSIRVRGLVSGVKQSSTIVTKKKEKPAAKKKTIIKKKSVV